jgi:transposase
MKFFQGNKITMFERPGNSPDMNPIDNLCSILKKRLGKMGCSVEERTLTDKCGVRTVE